MWPQRDGKPPTSLTELTVRRDGETSSPEVKNVLTRNRRPYKGWYCDNSLTRSSAAHSKKDAAYAVVNLVSGFWFDTCCIAVPINLTSEAYVSRLCTY